MSEGEAEEVFSDLISGSYGENAMTCEGYFGSELAQGTDNVDE